MEIRPSHTAAAVAVLAIAVWLRAGSSAGGEPDVASTSVLPSSATDTSVVMSRNEGSVVPCAFPLTWKIARVDPRFGLSPREVEETVRQATALWEETTGRELFSHDPETGFPVRLVYDERQAESRDRRVGEEELAEVADEIEARRAEIAEMERRHEEARRRYRGRVEALRERMSAHNDTVRMWNARGGAPEDVARRLSVAEEAIGREQLALEARQEDLDRQRAEVEGAFRDLRSRARAWERRATDLEEDFPSTSVEAGVYREAVRWENDRVTSVEREIRIYRFDDRDDLRRIASHELGHAMGLGHADVNGALMSGRYARAAGPEEPVAVRSADLDLLHERCPEIQD